MEKHDVEKRNGKQYSPSVEAARAQIWATLNAKTAAVKQGSGYFALSKDSSLPQGAAGYRGLLNAAQMEYLKEIQLRCFKIDMEVQEINTRLVNAELSDVLPRLYMVEVTDLLYKIDILVQQVHANAARMGVAAVQPRFNTAYLDYRLRGIGSYDELVQAVEKAAKRKALV